MSSELYGFNDIFKKKIKDLINLKKFNQGTEPVRITVNMYTYPGQGGSAGGPPPKPIDSISVDENTRRIQIRRITKDMEGAYILEASNAFGSVRDYFNLRVLDTPTGPRINLPSSVIRVEAGQHVNIQPEVHFTGRPQFTWSKDGASLLPEHVYATDQSLYIPRVSKSDQGLYTLTLVDDHGTAKLPVNLIVDISGQQQQQPDQSNPNPRPSNPTRIIVKQDMDVELDAGQNANLLCNIAPRSYSARVISTTSWLKGNRAQRERFPANIRPNQERLQIVKAKPSDTG